MSCATKNLGESASDRDRSAASNSAGSGSIANQEKNHQDQSREQLITELQMLERRVNSQADELRQTTLQLASTEQRERDRLARILHDDLQQLLLAAKWDLRSLAKQLRGNRPGREKLRHVMRVVDRSIDISRSLSRDLSPPALDSGLVPGLTSLVEHFSEAYGFRIGVQATGDFSAISDSFRGFLFDTIRELLINAAKHSNNTEAELQIKEGEGIVEVVVSDKGVGFDPRQLDRMLARGSGLLRILTRATHMGGQLQVDTTPGGGATFRMSIPRLQTK